MNMDSNQSTMNLAEINKAELDNGDTMSEYEIVEIPLDTRLPQNTLISLGWAG